MTPASTNQFAVVTGASSGIGYELARQFVEYGFDVLAVADSDRINGAAQRLSSDGRHVESLQADLASYEGGRRSIAKSRSSALDTIAINAGVGLGGPLADSDLEAQMNLLQLNVTGPVHLTTTCRNRFRHFTLR